MDHQVWRNHIGSSYKDFRELIRDGMVCEMRQFLVAPKKFLYKPVVGLFMIRCGRYTTLKEGFDMELDFPLCTYAPTPVDDLPRLMCKILSIYCLFYNQKL